MHRMRYSEWQRKIESRQNISEQYSKKEQIGWGSMDGRYKNGEVLRMVNKRRRCIKDECNKKTRMILSQRQKQSVTLRQVSYYGLCIYADEVMGMTNFWRSCMEKGLIITARYSGLVISFSEAIEIKITGKKTVTPPGKVFLIEIRWRGIEKVGGV